MHALRSAGEDDGRRPAQRQLVGRHAVRHDLAVDVQLAGPAGDQLGVLGTEIDDQNGVTMSVGGVAQVTESSPRWATEPGKCDDGDVRRALVLILLGLTLAVPARALATGAGTGSGDSGIGAATTTTIDTSFLDTKRDLGDCLNNSIDLPDCGRNPTQAGDRGGALQYATFGIMILGLVFIGWRVTKAVKARDAALSRRP
jgi:hypothetical protein